MGDWIEIKATLHALDHRNFICSECLNTYNGRKDADMMTAKLRASKGCEVDDGPVLHRLTGGAEFSRCVGNYFDQTALGLIRMHRAYELGVLPFPGSLSEQPSKVMDAFSVIDSHRAEVRAEQAKKQEMAMKRVRRGR